MPYPRKKAEDLLEVIRYGIAHVRAPTTAFGVGAGGPAGASGGGDQHHHHHEQQISHADELEKLANLKEKGIISKEEFEKMKYKIIHGDSESSANK